MSTALTQNQIDTELSRDGTVTEDASEGYLAEYAMGAETVVYWDDPRQYGIIVGYTGSRPDAVVKEGRFVIDLVEPTTGRGGKKTWRETGQTLRLRRNEFVVFGPANRDPGDPPAVMPDDDLGDGHLRETLTTFIAAATDILAAKQGDTGEAAFDVRLDISVDDEAERRQRSGGYSDAETPRRYRLLVKPTMQPLLSQEIAQVLAIAEEHDLQVWHSNAGLELHLSEEIPS